LWGDILLTRFVVYGTQPWHWYATQGLPVMLLTMVPLVIIGFFVSKGTQKYPMYLVIYVLIVYSVFAHKEFRYQFRKSLNNHRFIFPILPICIVYAGVGLWRLKLWLQNDRKSVILWILISLLIITNVLVGGYLSLVHQRGPIDVMSHLRNSPNLQSVHFLMPCHHTPAYSHIHKNITMRHLDCSPNLAGILDYMDEADAFFADPLAFVKREYEDKNEFPSHLVMYEGIEKKLLRFLNRNGYTRVSSDDDLQLMNVRMRQFFTCTIQRC
jgi:phosphatidylinositol glycan class B